MCQPILTTSVWYILILNQQKQLIEGIFFNDIQRDFSKINKTQNGDYLIPQFITSLVEHLGYGDLCFRSSLVKDGTNHVIFNPSDCPAISSKSFYLSEVNDVCGQYK